MNEKTAQVPLSRPIRRKIHRKKRVKVAQLTCNQCGLAFVASTAKRCQCPVARPKRASVFK